MPASLGLLFQFLYYTIYLNNEQERGPSTYASIHMLVCGTDREALDRRTNKE